MNGVLLMKKYITTIMLSAVMVLLGACGSPENKVLSSIKDFEAETAPALTSSIQSMIDYEAEMSGLFNEALTDEELADFKDEQSPLYQNLNERTELAEGLSKILETLQNRAEELESADVSGSETLNKETVQNLSVTLGQLADDVKNVQSGYEEVLSSETAFFESLKNEEADYNTLTDGMAEVNGIHEEVTEHYESINEQLATFQNYSNEVKNALGEETSDGEKAAQTESDSSGEASENSESEMMYTVDAETSAIVSSADDAESSAVLITIDDAPDENAVAMAHTLKELDAPAIFFVNGMFIESEEGKDKLREIHELGFEIGNHTYNHFNMREITPEDTALEIIDTGDLIEEAIGERPKFFRAPFGVNSEASISIAEEENMTVMNWTYGFDWESDYQEPGALSDIMVNTEMLGDGANLLMHDRWWTSEALQDIVKGLRDKGYSLIDPKLIDSEGGVTE